MNKTEQIFRFEISKILIRFKAHNYSFRVNLKKQTKEVMTNL